MQTPGQLPPDPYEPPEPTRPSLAPRAPAGLSGLGDRLALLAGLVLALSSFTDWYAGKDAGAGSYTLSVIGWHTGALGKLVFVIGLAVLALVALREAGIELPATVPESLIIIALGALATICVLIRLISIPDQFLPASGRGIGIYISLLAAVLVIVAGLAKAAEEL